MTDPFVHLHVHTSFSMLDGASKIDEMIKVVEADKSPALAITDHGNTYGLIEFYKECSKAGINPILGCELYTTAGSRFDKKKESKVHVDDSGEEVEDGKGKIYNHLTVLASSNTGYQNLLKISTQAFTEGYYYKPRCLMPGQEIVTREGFKAIESIEIGDYVLTHKGRLRKVVGKSKTKVSETIYGIKLNASYGRTVWMTGEHPVLILNRDGDLVWQEAKDILPGRPSYKESIDNWNSWVCLPKTNITPKINAIAVADFVAWDYSNSQFYRESQRKNMGPTRHYIEFPEILNLDYELGFILGLYVSEGWSSPNELGFAFNSGRQDLVQRVMRLFHTRLASKTNIHNSTTKLCTEIRIYNTLASELFAGLCGKGAKNKHLPDFFLETPKSFQKGLFDGVLQGDGAFKKNAIQLTQTSRQLAWQMRQLSADFTSSFSCVKSMPVSKNPAHSQQYSVNISVENTRFKKVISDEQFIYRPVSEILTQEYSGYVFNIEVEEDHSYVTDFVTHNCDIDLLAEHSEGLIATSGCLGGEVLQHLLHGRFKSALAVAEKYQSIFGKENYFIEVQDHGLEEQKRTNPQLVEIAKKIGAPLVVTNDTHYTYPGDHHHHDNLLCINTHSLKISKDRFRFKSNDHYIRSAASMRKLFSEDWGKQACDNTLLIAERCDVKLNFQEHHLPAFPLPDGYRREIDYLTDLAFKGLSERYSEVDAAISRLKYELETIDKLGFAGYFLIVWDLVKHARSSGIRVGAGRGSAAGALVSYCLGITSVDPLLHNLVFERFLNPDRISMPDIDLDFEIRHRESMIEYAKAKYGEDRVAQIVTFSRIKSRQAVRDTARIFGYSWDLGDRITKALPPLVMGVETPLSACLDESVDPDGYARAEQLRDLYQSDSLVKEVVDAARKIEGLHRQDGIHAAAVVIGDRPLVELTALQKRPGGPLVTQYEMNAIESLGLLKMDFLGLKNLDVLSQCLKFMANDNITLDIDHLPLDDFETFKLLAEGNTVGVFQLESDGMRQLLRRLRPENFNDISAVISLYRPGPMAANMHNEYADRKNGRQAVVSFHRDAEEILKDTYQIILYQEQILEIARKFASYTMAEADVLRKAMGKKIKEMMDNEREKFINGCLINGYEKEFAESLFKTIEGFSSYAFNKCLTGDTVVVRPTGNQYAGPEITIKELYDKLQGPRSPWTEKFHDPNRGVTILALDQDGRIRPKRIKDVVCNGVQSVWKMTLSNGSSIKSTKNHRHLTSIGWKELSEISVGDSIVIHGGVDSVKSYYRYDYRLNHNMPQHRGQVNGAFGKDNYGYAGGGHTALTEWSKQQSEVCSNCGKTSGRLERAHLDGDRKNNAPSNLAILCVSCHKKHDYRNNGRKKQWDVGHLAGTAEVISIEYAGLEMTYDVEMDTPEHNFVANGIVTHNSHSISYAVLSYQTAYLKTHYPSYYMASICSLAKDKEEVAFFVADSRSLGLIIEKPDINFSDSEFSPLKNGIRMGLRSIEGLGEKECLKYIEERQLNGKYTSLYDFISRAKPKSNALASLAKAGALDGFGYPRKGIVVAAKDIVDFVKKSAEKNKKQTECLFSVEPVLNVPIVEFSDRERVKAEYEALSVYLTGHPIDSYMVADDCMTVFEARSATVGKYIKISGLVQQRVQRTTKKGQKMATFELSDSTGVLKGLLFPNAFVQYDTVIRDGKAVEVFFKVGADRESDNLNYIVQSASLLAQSERPSTDVLAVFLPRGFASAEGRLAALKQVLSKHPGPLEVVLYSGKKTVFQLSERLSVQPSDELKKDLRVLFAKDSSR